MGLKPSQHSGFGMGFCPARKQVVFGSGGARIRLGVRFRGLHLWAWDQVGQESGQELGSCWDLDLVLVGFAWARNQVRFRLGLGWLVMIDIGFRLGWQDSGFGMDSQFRMGLDQVSVWFGSGQELDCGGLGFG